ncbi:pectin acetylesterase-family hydrolase [uncultured Hyphomonas sp.]|uniref:pectin acetylesterase-family hydrolase n=1 Tax=uncultured Hyphomonas sp. TaxID=225298 RepID=UPI002AAB3F1F|nr:pectin acetylesterase-family hydrolase [uncultured Hyphomonas sp.]
MGAAFGLAACGTPAQQTGTEDFTTPAPAIVASSPQAAEWRKVFPGGDTRCTDGTEFHFMVHEADPKELLFYLEGGGGCWNKASCDPNGSPTAKLNVADQKDPTEGIFDFSNPKNPFANYTVVYVPYCSGDVHIGDNYIVYPGRDETDPPLPVYHRGRANVQSAIDWVSAHHDELDDIFVTGVSAGAVPTPLYASILSDRYSDAKISSLGDGAGGYRRASPMNDRLGDWGVFNQINTVPGFENLTPSTWSYEQIYVAAAKQHPDINMARFDFAADPAQWRFLSGNSEFDTLLENLVANNNDIRIGAPDFRAYIAPGAVHTILQKNALYETTVNGVVLVDWIAALAQHAPEEDVKCNECD